MLNPAEPHLKTAQLHLGAFTTIDKDQVFPGLENLPAWWSQKSRGSRITPEYL